MVSGWLEGWLEWLEWLNGDGLVGGVISGWFGSGLVMGWVELVMEWVGLKWRTGGGLE